MQKPLKFSLRVPTDELVKTPCPWLHAPTENFASVTFAASLEIWRKAGGELLSGEIRCHQNLTDALKKHAIERSRSQQGWTEEFEQSDTEDFLTEYWRQLLLKEADLRIRAESAAVDTSNDDGPPARAPAPVAEASRPTPALPARRVRPAIDVNAPLDELEPQTSTSQRPAPSAPLLDLEARRHPKTLRLGTIGVLPRAPAPQRPGSTSSGMHVDIPPPPRDRRNWAWLVAVLVPTISGIAVYAANHTAVTETVPAVSSAPAANEESPASTETATGDEAKKKAVAKAKKRARLKARAARRRAQQKAAQEEKSKQSSPAQEKAAAPTTGEPSPKTRLEMLLDEPNDEIPTRLQLLLDD